MLFNSYEFIFFFLPFTFFIYFFLLNKRLVTDANKVFSIFFTLSYERWLKETISVFGEVHHFMSINSVTKKLQNYPDDVHYYPHIGKLVANKLSNAPNKDIPDDFGIILNKNNIDSYIQGFKKQVQNYNFSQ